MNKKILLAAPAAALGIAGLIQGNAFAAEVSDSDSLKSCLANATETVCTLTSDITIPYTQHWVFPFMQMPHQEDDIIEIKDGRSVTIDLGEYSLTSGLQFYIHKGSLTIDGTRATMTAGDNHPTGALFKIEGGSSVDSTATELTINSGVEVSSQKGTVITVDGDTKTKYNTTVNLFGDLKGNSDTTTGVSLKGYHTNYDNTAILNIGDGASITNVKTAIDSTVYSTTTVGNALLEATGPVVSLSTGHFTFNGSHLTATGEDSPIIKVTEAAGTDTATLEFNGGVYSSVDGVFYKESDGYYNDYIYPYWHSYKTIDNITINDGTFVASDLFDVESHFTDAHSGFITGGTFSNWDEADNDFVSNAHLKDFEQRGDQTIMTVTTPVVEDLPEGYKLELSRTQIAEEDLEKLAELINKAELTGTVLAEKLDVTLYDGTGAIITDTDTTEGDIENGITIRIKADFPELEEGASRKYYVVSCHGNDAEDPFCTESGEIIKMEATYDEETGELVLEHVKQFSEFYAVYEDTKPAAPNTGAGASSKLGGVVASTLSMFMLAGSAIATFIGKKFFIKK